MPLALYTKRDTSEAHARALPDAQVVPRRWSTHPVSAPLAPTSLRTVSEQRRRWRRDSSEVSFGSTKLHLRPLKGLRQHQNQTHEGPSGGRRTSRQGRLCFKGECCKGPTGRRVTGRALARADTDARRQQSAVARSASQHMARRGQSTGRATQRRETQRMLCNCTFSAPSCAHKYTSASRRSRPSTQSLEPPQARSASRYQRATADHAVSVLPGFRLARWLCAGSERNWPDLQRAEHVLHTGPRSSRCVAQPRTQPNPG